METIKEFYLDRIDDETGISGVGVVARGVVLPSGRVVLEWSTFHSSINIYQNFSDIEAIHGHHGKTRVVMGTPGGEIPPKKKRRKASENPKV
jgi:hypothetical protein